MWTIFKSLLSLLQYCFYYFFMFWFFFGCEACGILAPQLGIESATPASEGKVPVTGPPRKSLHECFYVKYLLTIMSPYHTLCFEIFCIINLLIGCTSAPPHHVLTKPCFSSCDSSLSVAHLMHEEVRIFVYFLLVSLRLP